MKLRAQISFFVLAVYILLGGVIGIIFNSFFQASRLYEYQVAAANIASIQQGIQNACMAVMYDDSATSLESKVKVLTQELEDEAERKEVLLSVVKKIRNKKLLEYSEILIKQMDKSTASIAMFTSEIEIYNTTQLLYGQTMEQSLTDYYDYLLPNSSTTEDFDKLEAVIFQGSDTISTLRANIDAIEYQVGSIDKVIADQIRVMMIIFIIVAFFAVVLGIFIAAFFIRSLSSRIKKMQSAIKRLSERDISQVIDVKSNDELGYLMRDVNETINILNNFFSEVRGSLEQNERVQRHLSSGSKQIEEAVAIVGGDIKRTQGEFKNLQVNISDSDDEVFGINKDISQMVENIEMQVKNTTDADRLLGDISSSLDSINESSKIQDRRTSELIEAVTTSSENLHETNRLLEETANGIGQINEVVEIINQIAEQTNILAMNAAIEAAHAGEAGKGFSVVAEEIRKLAESTSTNADMIHTNLENIADKVNLVVESGKVSTTSFDIISSSVNQLKEVSAQVSEAITTVNVSSDKTVAITGDVAKRVKALRESSENLSKRSKNLKTKFEDMKSIAENSNNNIENISVESNKVLDVSQDVKSVSDESSHQVMGLDILLRSFKLRDDSTENENNQYKGTALQDDDAEEPEEILEQEITDSQSDSTEVTDGDLN